uniref:DNA mismatch repair protein S5 domain-containing protein n=1 Tax=Ditylenchus dipsaci TaxID=166011 RepID=A0A915CMT7_9BILA
MSNFQEGAMIKDSLSNSAGRNGTMVTAEQLFYNCPSRRHALKYTLEEANRIADLLVKYSIHNPHVSFAFRRLDNHSCDFRTDGRGDRHSTIRALLLHLRSKTALIETYLTSSFEMIAFTFASVFSKKDKQKIFHLFINDRLVECDNMKKSIDLVFSSKDLMCPFMTISLQIDSKYIDVNDAIIDRIEQEIFQLITGYLEKGVIEVGRAAVSAVEAIDKEQRRGFNVHAAAKTLLIQQPSTQISNSQDWLMQPQTWDLSNPKHKKFSNTPRPASNQVRGGINAASNNGCSSPVNLSASSKPLLLVVNKSSPATPSNSCQRIRTEASNRSLDEFVSPTRFSFGDVSIATSALFSPAVQGPIHLVPLNLSNNIGEQVYSTFSDDERMDVKDEVTCSLSQYEGFQHQKRQVSRTFELDALDELRRTICSNCDQELMDLFRQHSFIGFFAQQFGVFQSKESAYVFHVSTTLRELFYQLVIFSFGNMGHIVYILPCMPYQFNPSKGAMKWICRAV